MLPNALTPQLQIASAALYTPPRTISEDNKAGLLFQILEASKSSSILSLEQITEIKNISSQLVEEGIHYYQTPPFSDGSLVRADVGEAESVSLKCLLPDGDMQQFTLTPGHPAYSFFSRTSLETRPLSIIPEESEDTDSLPSYGSLMLETPRDLNLDEIDYQDVTSPLVTSDDSGTEDDYLALTHPPSSVLPAYQPYSPPPAPYIGPVSGSGNQDTSIDELADESTPSILFSVLTAQNSANTTNNTTSGLIIDAMEQFGNNNYPD